MNKATIVLVGTLLLLFFIPFAYAEPPFVPQETTTSGTLIIAYPQTSYYVFGENITLQFHVYNSSGHIVNMTTTNCSIHIFDNTGDAIVEETMNESGIDFYYPAEHTLFTEGGYYPYLVQCLNEEAGFVSSFFQITAEGKEQFGPGAPLAMIILIPLVLAFLFMYGGSKLQEEHAVLSIFFFVMSFVSVYGAIHAGILTVIKYYYFPELQTMLGQTVFWVGVIIFVLFFYFGGYALYKFIDTLYQKRQEKLNY